MLVEGAWVIGWALLIMGGFLSVYIPLIPFMEWLGCVIGWVVIFIESIIAAPLWAMAHLEAEGEGMGQRASHGYLFMLRLMAYPMMLVTGFIGASILLLLIGSFVTAIFGYVMTAAQTGSDSMTGPIMQIFFLGAYAIIILLIVNKCFDFVSTVPSVVMTWIGGHFGKESYSDTQGSRAMMGALYSQVTGVGGNVRRMMARINDSDNDKPKGGSRSEVKSNGG